VEVTYKFDIEQTDTEQTQNILETIMSMSIHFSTIVNVNFANTGDFHIVGGHHDRAVVIITRLFDHTGMLVSGRLIDSTVSSNEDTVLFAVGPDEVDDVHQLVATTTKERTCDVVKYYLEHNTLPQNVVLRSSW